jgi:dipeptidyl aminopeptidase/acylaminoacyl peptidase
VTKPVFLATATLLVLVMPSTRGGAHETHVQSIDEALSLRLIGTPRISPDGLSVVYVQRETNWKDDELVRQLWMADVSTGKRFQLTRGKKSAGNPEWSPDGRWIAFVTEREASAVEPLPPEKEEKKKEEGDKAEKEDGSSEKPAARQIWLISPHGGEAWQLTKFESDIDEYHWSKDSTSIAFTAAPPETKQTRDRKEKYGEFDVFEKDYRQNQLWVVSVAAAEKDCLPAPAQRLVSDPSISINSFEHGQEGHRASWAGFLPEVLT